MKCHVRLIFFITMIIMVCSACVSCSSGKKDPVSPETASPTALEETEGSQSSKYELPDENIPAVKIGYYTVNSKGVIVRATSLISGSTVITPDLILGFLVDSLEDESVALGFDSVGIENSLCIISFDDSIYDIADQGVVLETAVLDAISQSILDNLDSVDGICFRIKGQAYSTANYSFAFDSVYMGK